MLKLPFQIAMLLFASAAASRAADDPFTGTWKIDAPKSAFSDGTFPKNMSITITLKFSDGELNYHSVNDTDKNKPSGLDYTAKLDWKPGPIANNPRFTQVAVRRLNKNEFEVLEMKDGDVLVGAVYELFPRWEAFRAPRNRQGCRRAVTRVSGVFRQTVTKL
jgi:hypothetical protein